MVGRQATTAVCQADEKRRQSLHAAVVEFVRQQAMTTIQFSAASLPP